MTDPQPAYSADGPECPYCGHTSRPDEPNYYNEMGFDLDCGSCGAKFKVFADCSWSWLSRPVTPPTTKETR